MIVPLQPSMFDILATQEFLRAAREGKGGRQGESRWRRRHARRCATRSAEQLHRFVEGLRVPVLGFLRDTQNYVQLAAHGLTLWDVASEPLENDLEQWEPIISGRAKRLTGCW